MRQVPQEQPPFDTAPRLKEWLSRLVINVNNAFRRAYDNILNETSLFVADFTDQEPVALDTPIQITFGPGEEQDDAEMTAAGELIIKREALYDLLVTLNIGRQGAAGGVANIYIRGLLNGVQIGFPLVALVDNERINVSLQYELIGKFEQGDIFTAELVRDSSGTNQGGLYAETSAVGWGTSPSARLRLIRQSEVITE